MKELYFRSVDDTNCEPLEYILQDAIHQGMETIELIEAVKATRKTYPDHIYCTWYGDVIERQQCRKNACMYHTCKPGMRICEHRGTLYTYGEKFVFNTRSGLPIG